MSGLLDIQTGSSVVTASKAEAEAGADNTKAMTPLRTAQAIAALAGGAGGLVLNDIWFVDSIDGNNATGDGTMMAPWATIQHAYAQGARNLSIRGNVGPLIAYNGLDLVLIGYGRGLSAVGAVEGPWGNLFANGRHMLEISSITVSATDGWNGNQGGMGESGTAAGPGTAAPELELRGVTVLGDVMVEGGSGGTGGSGGSGDFGGGGAPGGDGGSGSSITLRDCHVVGSVSALGGAGGAGGGGGAGYAESATGGSGANGGQGGAAGAVTLERCYAGMVVAGGGLGGAAGWGGSGTLGYGADGTAGSNGGDGLYSAWFSEVVQTVGAAPATVHFSMVDGVAVT